MNRKDVITSLQSCLEAANLADAVDPSCNDLPGEFASEKSLYGHLKAALTLLIGEGAVEHWAETGEWPGAWTLSDDSFDCDNTDGWRYGIYIDPESRHVSHWAHHGNGTPMPVWHSRAVIIPLPRGAVGSEVRDLLATDGVRTLIEALIGTYQGSRWDGSNHIGQWEDDTTSLACDLTELFEDVATYMRAADFWASIWTQATADDIRRDMAQLGRDVRGIARMIVADVGSLGQYVDESDMVATIEELLEEFPEPKCECECGCSDIAETTDNEGNAVCSDCTVHAVLYDGSVACSRRTQGFKVCPLCDATIDWGNIHTGGSPGASNYCAGRCKCSHWRNEENGGGWDRYEHTYYGDGDQEEAI